MPSPTTTFTIFIPIFAITPMHPQLLLTPFSFVVGKHPLPPPCQLPAVLSLSLSLYAVKSQPKHPCNHRRQPPQKPVGLPPSSCREKQKPSPIRRRLFFRYYTTVHHHATVVLHHLVIVVFRRSSNHTPPSNTTALHTSTSGPVSSSSTSTTPEKLLNHPIAAADPQLPPSPSSSHFCLVRHTPVTPPSSVYHGCHLQPLSPFITPSHQYHHRLLPLLLLHNRRESPTTPSSFSCSFGNTHPNTHT